MEKTGRMALTGARTPQSIMLLIGAAFVDMK